VGLCVITLYGMAGGYQNFRTKYFTSLILTRFFRIYRAVHCLVNYNSKRRKRTCVCRCTMVEITHLLMSLVRTCQSSRIPKWGLVQVRWMGRLQFPAYSVTKKRCLN